MPKALEELRQGFIAKHGREPGPDDLLFPDSRQQPLRLPRLQELGQCLFIQHGHITLPVLLGVLFLVNGLGHAFFNPTREVAIGVLELAAGVLLFAGVFLVHVSRIPAALVCYGISVSCVIITLLMQVGILIQQVSQ
jgi:hypothetical protein